MLSNNRVIWNNSGTLVDLSMILNNFQSETKVIDLVAAQDKLYIGSDVPFNHRYFSVSAPNAVVAALSVDIWDGSGWEPAIDVLDGTANSSGAALAQSGILSWKTDYNESWMRERSTEDMTDSGLSSLKIYNLYWARISISANVTGTTALKYVGHKFSKDEDLDGQYADLNRAAIMTAYKSGKTNWEDQHIEASEEIARDLKKQMQLWAKGQVFDWEQLTAAAVHKVAEIIYNAFGDEYEVRANKAAAKYESALEGVLGSGIDINEDGHVDDDEHEGGYLGGLVRV